MLYTWFFLIDLLFAFHWFSMDLFVFQFVRAVFDVNFLLCSTQLQYL